VTSHRIEISLPKVFTRKLAEKIGKGRQPDPGKRGPGMILMIGLSDVIISPAPGHFGQFRSDWKFFYDVDIRTSSN
jgi:hypothetical protein